MSKSISNPDTPCTITLNGNIYSVTGSGSGKILCSFTTMQIGYVVELNGNKPETDTTIHCRPGTKPGIHALVMYPSMAEKIRNGKPPA